MCELEILETRTIKRLERIEITPIYSSNRLTYPCSLFLMLFTKRNKPVVKNWMLSKKDKYSIVIGGLKRFDECCCQKKMNVVVVVLKKFDECCCCCQTTRKWQAAGSRKNIYCMFYGSQKIRLKGSFFNYILFFM